MAAPIGQPRLLKAAGWLAAWLLLFTAAFAPPRPPAADLDSSWRMVLVHASAHGWQWGRDLVFTYGPLGWLMGNTAAGPDASRLLAGAVITAALLATVLGLPLRRMSVGRRAAAVAFFVVAGATVLDFLHVAAVVVLWLELLALDGPRARWAWLGGAALAAVSSQIKSTHLYLCVAVLVAVGVVDLSAGRWRRPATLAAGFCIAFLGVWLACGQSLAWLPAWLRRSGAIAAGYNEAMADGDAVGPLLWALLGWGGLVAAATALRRPGLRAGRPALAVMAVATFLQWKHGFVRADGHMLVFFLHLGFAVVTAPRWLPAASRGLARAALTAAAAAALLGAETALPGVLKEMIQSAPGRMWRTVCVLAAPRTHLDRLAADWRTFGATHALPTVRRLGAGAPSDVLGQTQAVLLANVDNYRPRPVFQSYSAYTPLLARLNAAALAAASGPPLALFHGESIDHRPRQLDDGPALLELLRHYSLVSQEKDWFVFWRRTPPAAWDLSPDRQVTVRPDEVCPVPAADAGAIWLEATFHPTLLGRLRELLYKPPVVWIDVDDAAGETTSFRLTRGQAAAGWLVSPVVDTQEQFVQFLAGRNPHRVRSLRFRLPRGATRYLGGEIALHFSRLPPVPAEVLQLPGPLFRLYSGFSDTPTRWRSAEPPRLAWLGDRPAAMLHAPGEAAIPCPPGATRVTGRFGTDPRALTSVPASDGVDCTVLWRAPGGAERILLFRFLDPRSVPADRDPVAFDLALPDSGGELILRAGPGPHGNAIWDWTAWQDVVFHRGER